MPSKHVNAGQLIRRGLYDDLHSFAELEQRISALGDENTKAVGDAFEVFVEGYLATHQKMQAENVWLVGHVPPEIRGQLNLPSDAKGIDGVFRTRTGALVPYQVKFRSLRAYLTYTEIAPFLGLTERATDRIVFTNSNELAEDVKNRDAIRTVRGIDFDDLTEDDPKAVTCWLRERPVAIPKFSPREPDQIEALTRIRETLVTSDRVHVVMACGTGKTLVALWAVEALKPKTVLVLVPSLTLLQQTLDEWSRNNSWGRAFTYLCVCSDPTVVARDTNDPIDFDTTDLDFRVDTSPDEVRRFLETNTTGIKVVFSTYQSSPVVAQGAQGLAPLDVAIFDEAHKTTGPQGGLFAHSLSDRNIQIRQRLFFTATPRHYDIRHRDKEGDFRVVSMDDETVYGPRAYTLTFGSAARQGIICNYKVVISIVDGQEVNDFVLKHGITLVEGDLIRARWVANQIAVERAIEKTGATRAISFHSRVSSAKEFSTDGPRGIKQFLPEFSVFHVNGEQKSSERKQLIRAFRDAPKALITNARCLTEGIDVPAADMVAFIDPRHSKVDIAQATGRAMRKPQGSGKEVGYVVIPLFLETESWETLEAALKRSNFGDIVHVLSAMEEQDEDLVQIIRELREARGYGEIFDPRRLVEKIEVVGPSIELSALRANIFAEIVDTLGIAWDEWYGRLKTYREREGHCRVPQNYKENGYRLGQWVAVQRRTERTMVVERKARLDALGFEWDPYAADWEEGFERFQTYVKEHKHCRVPALYKTSDGYRLGQWVSIQRLSQGKLASHRKARLDSVGFEWNPHDTDWEEGFKHLQAFVEEHKHCRVPAEYKSPDGYRLGRWATLRVRHRKDTLNLVQIELLDALGLDWDPINTQWEEGFDHLQIYVEQYGNCRVSQKYKSPDDYRLGGWVSEQRHKPDAISPERKVRLDLLGFEWDPFKTDWEKGFQHLTAYVSEYKHCRVPHLYKSSDGYGLGGWVLKQRQNRDKLSTEQQARLDALGFDWDPIAARWNDGYDHLTAYVMQHGHCRVPLQYKSPDGYRLGKWVGDRRELQKTLSSTGKEQLTSLGFIWNAHEALWEEGLEHLTTYVKEHKDCRVPIQYKSPDGYVLGRWVSNQRLSRDKLPSERKARLDALGFDWDPITTQWEDGFVHLQAFAKEHKHCRVPAKYKSPDGYKLGQWVNNLRAKCSSLSVDRKARLDALGFDWDTHDTAWREGIGHLQAYIKEYGDCRVSQKYKSPDGYNLGQWVSNYRQRRGSLPDEKISRLDNLGFIWDTSVEPTIQRPVAIVKPAADTPTN